MARHTHRLRANATVRLLVAGAIGVGALGVGAASAAAAPNGTASFNYQVAKLSYTAEGAVSASRESVTCVAGVSSDFSANAVSAPAEIVPLNGLGEASLDIEESGTRGRIDAEDYFEYVYRGTYRETTACEGGTVASSAFSFCDTSMTALTSVYGLVKGGVGSQVRINWTISQTEVAGAWIPNLICGSTTVNFLSKETCRSPKLDLGLLTRKNVKVAFVCDFPLTTAIPAGTGFDSYEGFSTVSGVIKLKRLKD